MRYFRAAAIFLAVFTIPALSFGADGKDDISSLKQEVELLKKQCQEYKDINTRLEERINALEKKIDSAAAGSEPQAVQAPAAAGVVPQPSRAPADTALEKRVGVLEEQLKSVKAASPAEALEIPRTGEVVFPGVEKFGLPEYLTRGFYFSGYFRSGAGGNSRGGKMEAFQAPDTAAKYRLGNEQETYLEAIFTEKNWNPNPDGVDILTQIRLAFKTQQNQSEDTGISNTPPPSSLSAVKADKVLLREMYAQMGKFIDTDPGAKIWMGQRFYRLPELDIDDFWWSDMSGYGGGFEDLSFFDFGKLNIAYIGYASNDLNQTTNHGRYYKNNLHFMLKDVDVPAGKGTFWVNGGYMAGGKQDGVEHRSMGGVDLGLMHVSGGPKFNNQLGLQFGYGVNSSLSASANIPPADTDKKSWTFRQTDMYNYKFNDRFSVQVIDVLQYLDNGQQSGFKTFWASFGLRPVIGLTRRLALEIEPGLDYVNEPGKGYNSCLAKITTALRVAPNGNFDAHPRFRFFATYANWGSDFKGLDTMGGSGFRDKNDGANFGVQCEHWW